MPNIGSMHPYVVHAVIGFLIAGIIFRLASLVPRWSALNYAAASLLIVGAGTAVVAVRSGSDAHGPVERVPGARQAVQDHEEWGNRTRNLFLVIAAVELAALALPSRRRLIHYASATLGIVGLGFIFETGDLGGDLVYSYAGGIGIRTGDPADVDRLLLAGLYQEAMKDRRENRPADAARLIDEMGRRFPDAVDVALLRAESLLRDQHDPVAALAALDSMQHLAADPRTRRSIALTRVYALLGAGRTDTARMVVERLAAENPNVARYKALLDSIPK